MEQGSTDPRMGASNVVVGEGQLIFSEVVLLGFPNYILICLFDPILYIPANDFSIVCWTGPRGFTSTKNINVSVKVKILTLKRYHCAQWARLSFFTTLFRSKSMLLLRMPAESPTHICLWCCKLRMCSYRSNAIASTEYSSLQNACALF